jgi:hypothetical protein
MDAGFFSDPIGAIGTWQVGDSVNILFSVDDKYLEPLRRGVSDLCDPHPSLCPQGDPNIQIRCKVVEKHHGLAWQRVGSLMSLGDSVVLEAIDGYYEDVLKLVLFNEVPAWMSVGE